MKNVDGMMAREGRKDWETPAALFNACNTEFCFTVDACAQAHNAKLPRFYSPEMNGLVQDWSNERVWCNPPYGVDLVQWVERMTRRDSDLCVGLLPARTDTKWFHRWCLPLAAEIRFIEKRVRFVGAPFNAPFPSMLVVWTK